MALRTLVAGVDVGGTKISVVVTHRAYILYEQVTPTDRSSLVCQVAGLVDDARSDRSPTQRLA